MFRRLLFTALLVVSAGAHAEKILPLQIGDAEIRFAMPDDYLPSSTKAPVLFKGAAAALPPSIRLVEAVLSESDLKRSLAGQDMLQPYVQVQTMRDAEALTLSAEDWRQMQPLIASQLGANDLSATAQAMGKGAGERMAEATGAQIDLRFGEVGKPRVYSQADGVIRYVLRLPISGSVNGQAKDTVLDCAGAMLVLHGKLLTVNVYQTAGEDDNFTAVRRMLDQMVQRTRALNAPPAGNPGKARS